ncbi:MAG: hypothetical protein CV087_23030 [Candidatus Brocadia sp. WS118]|nr:MAG: hypothetical protein CV087_23030 [Candidatus Brocadia sp. WS118]
MRQKWSTLLVTKKYLSSINFKIAVLFTFLLFDFFKFKKTINTMKTIAFYFTLFFLFFFEAHISFGQLKVRNDAFIQIGYEGTLNKTLSFGKSTGVPNNGSWGIEYWQQKQGLNFYKPWPTDNWGEYVLFLRDDKNVGIGFPGLQGYKLSVLGDVRVFGVVIHQSDARFKTDIKPITSNLEKILRLQGKSYYYDEDKISSVYLPPIDESSLSEGKHSYPEQRKDSELNTNKNRKLGFLAQEVMQVVPEVVFKDEMGYYGIDYNGLIPILLEAVKEQNEEIQKLENRIIELEKR